MPRNANPCSLTTATGWPSPTPTATNPGSCPGGPRSSNWPIADTPLPEPDRTQEPCQDPAPDQTKLSFQQRPSLTLVLDHLTRGSLYLAVGHDPGDLWPPSPDDYRETVAPALRGRLPLLVPLRDFGAQLDCRPGVRQWTRVELEAALRAWLDHGRPGGLDGATLQAHLRAGSTLVLLDGVDEVPRSGADGGHPRALLLSGLADALPDWTAAGNRVLLSSRPYGLDATELARLGLPQVRLAPLPEALQNYFMARWFHTLGRPQQADALRAHLDSRRTGLGPLTQNPLLLSSMCIIYGNGGRLPEDRYQLYRRIIDNVLYNRYRAVAERWDSDFLGRLAADLEAADVGARSSTESGSDLGRDPGADQAGNQTGAAQRLLAAAIDLIRPKCAEGLPDALVAAY